MEDYKFFVTEIEEKSYTVKNKSDLKRLIDEFLKGKNTKMLITKNEF